MEDPHPQLSWGFRRFKLRRFKLRILRWNGGLVYRRQEAISTRWNRLDITGFPGIVAQRVAQFPDVSSKQFISYAGAGPDAVEQFPFGHQPLRILYEIEQNLKGLRSQVYKVGIPPKLFIRGVQPKRGEYKNSPRCHCVPMALDGQPLYYINGNSTEVPRAFYGLKRTSALF